jgi:hypothetical protein
MAAEGGCTHGGEKTGNRNCSTPACRCCVRLPASLSDTLEDAPRTGLKPEKRKASVSISSWDILLTARDRLADFEINREKGWIGSSRGKGACCLTPRSSRGTAAPKCQRRSGFFSRQAPGAFSGYRPSPLTCPHPFLTSDDAIEGLYSEGS